MTTITDSTINPGTMPTSTRSLRRLVAVLAVAGVVSGACGSSPFDGRADEPAGARLDRAGSDDDGSDTDSSDRERTDGGGSGDACGSLDEARRLGERYGELVDGVVLDAARSAEDDPDADRDQLALEAIHEMITELDPVAVELLDAYRDAADAAPADLADDLELLAEFTEDIIDSWSELLERPDADPEAFLETIFAGDEEQLREAIAATRRVNAFTLDECGFVLGPGA